MHQLQPDAVDAREREIGAERPRRAPYNLWVSQHLRRRMPTPDRPWDVITLTRDPLAQSVSSFFQSAVRRNYIDDNPNAMLATFLSAHDIFGGVDWFDNELRRYLGIDIYDRPLNRGEPLFIRTPTVRLLLMRREDLDRVGPAALSEFAGVKIQAMEHTNVGAQKNYADAYQRFRGGAVLPRALIDRIYDSRYARHFYSDDEIARFRAAWRTD
jgi:hypothetical protein